jgi:RHS repeat-associated protein
VVAVDVPHHVTQRGNARQYILDSDADRMVSLDLLRRYAQLHELSLVDDLNPTGHAQVMDEIVGGVVQREYTYGLQRISQYQVIGNLWTPSFYVYDGAGSVRQLANAAGAVTDTYEYDAFGVTLSHTGTMPNNYMYRGEQYDPDLGLYYLRARYYDSLTGRFLSRDPNRGYISIPVTLHKYLYASGNPVNRVDRSGKADEEEEAGLDLRSLTKSVNYAAKQLQIERQLFGNIIHAIKDAAGVGGATDLYFSIPSGDVYLLIEEEYELIDNVFGYM